MRYNMNRVSEKYDFFINGASYAGQPRNNTIMYVSKKVEHLVENLMDIKECFIIVEKGILVPEELQRKNCVLFSDSPQFEYAKFAMELEAEEEKQEQSWGYTLTEDGYYIGKNVSIGKNAYIEPNVLIGHGCEIGDHAKIYYGTMIKKSVIGDNFVANEYAVIGANGFTMAEDGEGNKIRIPSLGRVVIGNCVEIGAFDNISRGSGGDTRIDHHVKIDAHVHIGHDAHLGANTEITAGAVIGGFVDADESSYVGINAVVRNRKSLGKNSLVGMGAVVTKSVPDYVTVVGNPAKKLRREGI